MSLSWSIVMVPRKVKRGGSPCPRAMRWCIRTSKALDSTAVASHNTLNDGKCIGKFVCFEGLASVCTGACCSSLLGSLSGIPIKAPSQILWRSGRSLPRRFREPSSSGNVEKLHRQRKSLSRQGRMTAISSLETFRGLLA